MPIPDLKGDLTREEIISKYADFDLHKIITIEWIEVDKNRNIYKRTLRYNADTLPCKNVECFPWQLSFLAFQPTGVYWTCAVCRRTTGPLTTDAPDAYLVDRKQISVNEALEVIKKTGQKVPLGMDAPAQSKFRIVQ